jgi:hypothetical protein
MNKGATPVFRGICISATLYAVLFLGHIIAAAQQYDAVFQAIAVTLSIMTFLIGPCIVLFGQITEFPEKIRANTFGFPISIALAIGLSWAYEGQSFDIVRSLAFVFVAVGVHFQHRQLIFQKHAEKMG